VPRKSRGGPPSAASRTPINRLTLSQNRWHLPLRLPHFANNLHQTVKTSSVLRRLKPPTTMASTDFCDNMDSRLETPSFAASSQISQGKTRNCPPKYPPHKRRLAPDDVGLRVLWPSRPASLRPVCGSCSSDREFAGCFLQIQGHPWHPYNSASSFCHQGLDRDSHPTSYFPVRFRLPVESVSL
jgi:hypothetical protein